MINKGIIIKEPNFGEYLLIIHFEIIILTLMSKGKENENKLKLAETYKEI